MRKSWIALLLALMLVLGACNQATDTQTTDPITGGETETLSDAADTERTEAAQTEDTEAQAPEADATVYPIEVQDGLGNTVRLETEPETIVSLAPNVTEILFALGLGDKIVGTSEFSDYPAEAADVEAVGGAMGFDLERITEMDPDLIITNGVVEGLDEAATNAEIAVAGYYPQNMEEVQNQILQVGELANRQVEAQGIVANMKERTEAVVASVEGLDKPTVFYEVWGDPLMVAGSGSFINEIITLAGGEDVAGDAEPYSNYDVEQLVAADPDIYLINDGDPNVSQEILAGRPGYESLSALQNDRVLTVNADLISRPGPRLIDGLEAVADLLHPDRAN